MSFYIHSDAETKAIVLGLRARAKELKKKIVVLYIKAVSRTKGVHDLMVAWDGVTYMLEVKGKKGDLSEEQIEFHANWPGGPQAVVRTLDEAMVAIGMEPPF